MEEEERLDWAGLSREDLNRPRPGWVEFFVVKDAIKRRNPRNEMVKPTRSRSTDWRLNLVTSLSYLHISVSLITIEAAFAFSHYRTYCLLFFGPPITHDPVSHTCQYYAVADSVLTSDISNDETNWNFNLSWDLLSNGTIMYSMYLFSIAVWWGVASFFPLRLVSSSRSRRKKRELRDTWRI